MDSDVVYINNGILISHKKEWNLDICSMEGPKGWNKSDREQQRLHDFTYMWNLDTK